MATRSSRERHRLGAVGTRSAGVGEPATRHALNRNDRAWGGDLGGLPLGRSAELRGCESRPGAAHGPDSGGGGGGSVRQGHDRGDGPARQGPGAACCPYQPLASATRSRGRTTCAPPPTASGRPGQGPRGVECVDLIGGVVHGLG
jgi:hypothetical protein